MAISGLAILAVLILLNGVLALAEISLISARKTRLQELSQTDERAKRALSLSSDPQRIISSVQLGSILLTIVTGMFAGGICVPAIARSLGGSGYVYCLAAVLTALILAAAGLIFGEVIPKRIAIGYAESVATAVARPSGALIRFFAVPSTWLANLGGAILSLFGLQRTRQTSISEEEINRVVAEGTAAGVVDEAEQDIVRRVLRLGDKRVDALMTPRTEMEWIDLNEADDNVLEIIGNTKLSYYPVCEGQIDSVKGMLRVKDLWRPLMNKENFRWRDYIRPSLTVPNTVSALRLLEVFKQAGQHVAIVLDEFGGTDGMVSLNDVTEAVLGDLPASVMPGEGWIIQRADGSWLIDGALPLDDFRDTFGVSLGGGEKSSAYQTLGGFIAAGMGRLPAATDCIEHGGYRFEVLDMDGHRVDKVLVSLVRQDREEGPGD